MSDMLTAKSDDFINAECKGQGKNWIGIRLVEHEIEWCTVSNSHLNFHWTQVLTHTCHF